MTTLPPWAYGPFELLLHAEGHLRSGDDFDRRIALISFDNAIEVAITTYLTLHPLQRGGKTYPRSDIDKWLENYHTKLDFLDQELGARGAAWLVDRSHIIWAHEHRNEQYHGGHKGTPEKSVLSIVRKAALWIFSILYNVPNIEDVLEQAILDITPPQPPTPDKDINVAIDGKYGIIEVGEQSYYASELLFSVDYQAYRDLGSRLNVPRTDEDSSEEEEA